MSDNENAQHQEYMSVSDCVMRWKLPPEMVRQFCDEGKIAGAAKFNGDWIIPVNAEKPIIKSKLSRPVIPASKLQEAALEHIENGDLFDVEESTFDGKPFIVSRVFPRQGPTLEELLVQFMKYVIENETGRYFDPIAIQKLKAQLRKDSNAAKETFDDYILSYRKKLKNYGFSDEDAEFLLEKIAADYEPFIV